MVEIKVAQAYYDASGYTVTCDCGNKIEIEHIVSGDRVTCLDCGRVYEFFFRGMDLHRVGEKPILPDGWKQKKDVKTQ